MRDASRRHSCVPRLPACLTRRRLVPHLQQRDGRAGADAELAPVAAERDSVDAGHIHDKCPGLHRGPDEALPPSRRADAHAVLRRAADAGRDLLRGAAEQHGRRALLDAGVEDPAAAGAAAPRCVFFEGSGRCPAERSSRQTDGQAPAPAPHQHNHSNHQTNQHTTNTQPTTSTHWDETWKSSSSGNTSSAPYMPCRHSLKAWWCWWWWWCLCLLLW